MNKKIILIFIFAFLIRLIALNQSLWLDEAVTANVVKNFSFLQIINKFSPTDFHPPLYYLFMKAWTNAFGYSEIALRMPSVLFSLATGWIVYLIGGTWAAVFFLFNPLIVYYSQEARMYLMSTFFLMTALYFFLKNKNSLFFGLLISLSFLTFYGSIFLIIPMMLYLFFKKRYKLLFVSCLLFLVSFITISPLLLKQFANSKVALSNVANWSLVLGKANIKNLFLIPIKFSIGRISFEPKWFYYFISGSWLSFVTFLMFKNSLKIENLKLKIALIYLFIFPLVLGFFISFFTPMLQYFRFLYLIPIVCLLLGFRLSGQAKFNRGGYVLAGGFLIFSLVYLLLPQFHREDWKSLVKNLPKDKPVYMIASSSDPVKYYKNNLIIKELRIADYRLDEKQIAVIPYTSDIYGLDYKKDLSDKKYFLKSKKVFNGLELEFWSRR